MDWDVPTLENVLEARERISPHLRATPLFQYGGLSELVGAEIFVKHENHQPVGAFKVRGGVNLVSQLSDDERERGVIAASTGNHGQSIAFAARLFGVAATICVPEQANPVKVAAIRGLGAELVFHGRDFDDAREHCERLAAENGHRYVHSGNEPLLIAGVGTETLEILEEQPEIEVIVVPIGGGSGAAGACIVAKAIDPEVKVASMRGLGAELVFHGRDFDDAREHCEALAREQGYRYVHSGNEPLLIAGVGTEALEILEERPDTEVIIVPIGGGSGAAGVCIVADAVNPDVRVIGVQSDAAPTAYNSWRGRQLLEGRMETDAEGLATRTAFELPQRILWDSLDDFVLVSDDEIREAQSILIETTRNLVELAGAAPLAAALKLRDELEGKRVALVLSGGNASRQQLLDALAQPARRSPDVGVA